MLRLHRFGFRRKSGQSIVFRIARVILDSDAAFACDNQILTVKEIAVVLFARRHEAHGKFKTLALVDGHYFNGIRRFGFRAAAAYVAAAFCDIVKITDEARNTPSAVCLEFVGKVGEKIEIRPSRRAVFHRTDSRTVARFFNEPAHKLADPDGGGNAAHFTERCDEFACLCVAVFRSGNNAGIYASLFLFRPHQSEVIGCKSENGRKHNGGERNIVDGVIDNP